jgi:uncharacterized membrane protein HdeD (DUF308 family)
LEADMTDPHSRRPDAAGSPAGVAQSPGQPTIPPQTGPGTGGTAAAGPGLASEPGGPSGAGGGPGISAGLTGAIARMAWPAALVAAIGMIAVGILLLVWPSATLTVVAILIGAALIVTGLLRLFDGVTARGESGGMRAADIVIGLLAVIVGLYALKHHSLTVIVLALVVGVLWTVHGIGDLIVAASAGNVPGRGLRVVTGLVSLAAGLVILFWPGISLVLLLTILGAWLLFYGLMLAVLAFQLRRDAKIITRAARTATA